MSDTVLVTGGCGFIGSAVVQELVAQGMRVRVLDDLSKEGATPPAGAEHRPIDLTDASATRKAFEGASRAVHLAAKIGGIGYFHKHPATILSENNKLCSSVFEAASACRFERLVYVSSSMVFESATRFPCREEDLDACPSPVTAYGLSKFIGERYCRAFAEEFGLSYAIVRPFNAYGPNEYPGEEIGESHVIPDLIKKLLEGADPLSVLGDGNQTRCFTHVRDLARGIRLALQADAARNDDFNLGTAVETPVRDLAASLWTMTGRKGVLRLKHEKPFRHDVRRRVPDVSKAKRVLGWEPKIPLDDGLREVVEWIRRSGRIASARA
ncbi:MAG: NAD-dependent epimerase/dehydratase family protein [Planctomycetes bacterium]|nr:NAD-dependent epimerase/dehydratase family protein [Planctomycetota bacterium]